MKRRELFLGMHPLCAHCEARGVTTVATEVDHRIPLHQGGADEWSNLQALCHECHAAKTTAERVGGC